MRWDAQVLHPAASRAQPVCPDRLAGLCKPLESLSATCNFGCPFSLGILRFAAPFPT